MNNRIESLNHSNDLERFINGEIRFEDIQGDIPGHIGEGPSIYWSIIDARKEASFYSKNEQDLYEKLCYADALRLMDDPLEPCEKYVYYLTLKDKCSRHKLDWDCLLNKIKKVSKMNVDDIETGKKFYKSYKEGGGDIFKYFIDDYGYQGGQEDKFFTKENLIIKIIKEINSIN